MELAGGMDVLREYGGGLVYGGLTFRAKGRRARTQPRPPCLPLDWVSDLVGWRDLGGNQRAVLILVGHGHFGSWLQAFHGHTFTDFEGCAVFQNEGC